MSPARPRISLLRLSTACVRMQAWNQVSTMFRDPRRRLVTSARATFQTVQHRTRGSPLPKSTNSQSATKVSPKLKLEGWKSYSIHCAVMMQQKLMKLNLCIVLDALVEDDGNPGFMASFDRELMRIPVQRTSHPETDYGYWFPVDLGHILKKPLDAVPACKSTTTPAIM